MAEKCELCQQPSVLQESHLLPKALYKHLRDKDGPNPNPLVFSAQDEHQSSRQAFQPLLCFECEQRFHKHGENWVLSHSARDTGRFKLRELLLAHPCEKLHDDLYCFRCTEIPEVDTDALCYFALSVIWRAAVRSWRIDNLLIEQLVLGPYTEPFRSYLCGSGPFPDNMALFVTVSTLENVLLMCTQPQTRKWNGYACHFFSIPGLTFAVYCGKLIPQLFREGCIHRGAGRPIFYTPLDDLVNIRDFNRLAAMRRASAR